MLTENMIAIIFPNFEYWGNNFLKPISATHIGPPCGLSGLSIFRYNMESVTSMSFIDIPNIAIIHIQKIAPGPPSVIARATPLMFPSPTVPDKAVVSAWKWLIMPLSS